MKTFSQSIKQVAVVSGLFLGAFVLSALAADWTPPTANPPSNNTPAPINVGTASQVKAGPFAVGQGTVAESGLDFQVAKVAKLGALWVSGDAKIVGTTTTDRLTVGGVNAGNAGYVLTNDNLGSGRAEWKPNTSGLSGASRIYCAAVSDGRKYLIPKDSTAEIYKLAEKINTEVTSETTWTEQLLHVSSPSATGSTNMVGILKASFGDTSLTGRDITTTNAPKASCPTGKELIFHAMVGSAKDEQDFNNEQRIVNVVNGDYTNNSISCVTKGNDRPMLVIGVGLCI